MLRFSPLFIVFILLCSYVQATCTKIIEIYPTTNDGILLETVPIDEDFRCVVKAETNDNTIACGFDVNGKDKNWCRSDTGNFDGWHGSEKNIALFNCRIPKEELEGNPKETRYHLKGHEFEEGCDSEIKLEVKVGEKAVKAKAKLKDEISDLFDPLFPSSIKRNRPSNNQPSNTHTSTSIDRNNFSVGISDVKKSFATTACEQVPNLGGDFQMAKNMCRSICTSCNCNNVAYPNDVKCLNTAPKLTKGAKSILIGNIAYATYLQCLGYAQAGHSYINNLPIGVNKLIAGDYPYPSALVPTATSRGMTAVPFRTGISSLKPGQACYAIWPKSSEHIAIASPTRNFKKKGEVALCEWNYDWNGSGRCRLLNVNGKGIPEYCLIQVKKVK